jgi:hypothetical protein
MMQAHTLPSLSVVATPAHHASGGPPGGLDRRRPSIDHRSSNAHPSSIINHPSIHSPAHHETINASYHRQMQTITHRPDIIAT